MLRDHGEGACMQRLRIETIEMKIWLNQFVQFVLNSAIEDVSTWIEKQAVICGDKKQPVK